MNVFNFLKQLRRKLRSKRRWLSLGAFILLAGASFALQTRLAPSRQAMDGLSGAVQSVWAPAADSQPSREQKETIEMIKRIPDKRESFMQKAYVCGEELQSLGALSSSEILGVYKEHPQWTVTLNAQGQVYFTERIDDLSPECKQQAYFGIDESGNLSLFSGVPGRDNVIRTFFQLNIHHLESSLPGDAVKDLYNGIRVKDLAEYNSVLSTYSDFAVEDMEKAMSPQM